MTHRLESYYYIFPEKKPEWFTLNETTKRAVQRDLDKNFNRLASKVAAIRKKVKLKN